MVLPETQRRRTGFCPNRRVAGRITRKTAGVQDEMVSISDVAVEARPITRSAGTSSVVVENRSGADVQVREHLKRTKRRWACGGAEFADRPNQIIAMPPFTWMVWPVT
jgi:hypothetical protein